MTNLELGNKAHLAKPYLIIALTVTFSILVVWFPFIFRIAPAGTDIYKRGFELVLRMHDGPEYAIASKSLYRADVISKMGTFDPKYFAVHPPGYPLLIKIVSPFVGYLYGMLFVNYIATIILGWTVYYLFQHVLKLQQSLYLSILFLLIPRMLLASATGSSEVTFLLFSTLAVVLVSRKSFILASIAAAYASFTRVPGVLLGVTIGLYCLWTIRDNATKRGHIMVMFSSFIGLLLIFLLYFRQYGDFFAYFHSSAVVPTGIIYSQFLLNVVHITDKYLEDILFYFGFGWFTLINSVKKYDSFIYLYLLANFVFVLTIQHRDISRYILPCMPYLIAMNSKWLTSKPMKITFLLLMWPAYLYILKFIATNSYLLSIDTLN